MLKLFVIIHLFVQMSHDLAQLPSWKIRKIRDELSHNIFLMLQECNKFREHQAREILISTLEQQLERRREGLALLKKEITAAEENLESLKQFRGRA